MANKFKVGDIVIVDTNTSPSKTGRFFLTTKVKDVTEFDIITQDKEPYFGYDTFNWNQCSLLTNHIVITFKDNAGRHFVTPVMLNQFWSDLKSVKVDKLELAVPVGIFLENKDSKMFQSNCVDAVRMRTTPIDILGQLAYPIQPFDNTLNEEQLKKVLQAKYS